MSLHSAKLSKNPLVFAGAVLVFHVAAAAADPIGDVQQQARDLLTWATTAHSAPQPGPREDNATSPAVDAQESARQLLLGTTGSRTTAAHTVKRGEVAGGSLKTEARKRPVAHGDAQAAAREVLLGEHRASDAPQLAARRTR